MASSSADCVFGLARLISSPTTRLAKTAPGLNSNSRDSWSKIETPVTSLGSRSGVNWMRRTEQSMLRASDLASIVLPTPGHVLDEQVPLGEQHHQRQADDVGLALDDALDVGRDARRRGQQVVQTCGAGTGGAAYHLGPPEQGGQRPAVRALILTPNGGTGSRAAAPHPRGADGAALHTPPEQDDRRPGTVPADSGARGEPVRGAPGAPRRPPRGPPRRPLRRPLRRPPRRPPRAPPPLTCDDGPGGDRSRREAR